MGGVTFAKFMILLCLIGSGALAYQDWKQYQSLNTLRSDLRPGAGKVEQTVVETQKLGRRYAELQKALSGDALAGKDNPLSYIYEIADKPMVDLGTVDIQTSSRAGVGGANTVDKIYTITPADRNRSFPRYSIANFLFTLEEKSPRIRVTKITIDQMNRDQRAQIKPEEYPADTFSFTAQVTSRERKGE